MKVTTTDLGRTVTIDGTTWTVWSEAPGPRNFHAFTHPEGGVLSAGPSSPTVRRGDLGDGA